MTDVSLREHLEAQIRTLADAVAKSENLLNTRLEGMNEFRAALKDQADQMMPRNEATILLAAIDNRLRRLEDAKAKNEGRNVILAGATAIIAAALTAVLVTFLS